MVSSITSRAWEIDGYVSSINCCRTHIQFDDVGTLGSMIYEGYTINYISSEYNGSIALHIAAEYGSITASKLLIDAGADANISNNNTVD